MGWRRPDGTPFESLNHYSKGAVVSFLHRYVAGIRLLENDGGAAYRHFRVQPQPGGGIAWAQAEHDSPYGRIESSWRLSDDAFELVVTVPPGTTAQIVLPNGTDGGGVPRPSHAERISRRSGRGGRGLSLMGTRRPAAAALRLWLRPGWRRSSRP